MRRKNHAEADASHTGIDLAPMLDFVLNLLIFFIITAVFVKEVGITVSRPSAKTQQQEEKKKVKTILIQILQTGEIVVNGRAVDLRAVRPNVERYHAESPDSPVIDQNSWVTMPSPEMNWALSPWSRACRRIRPASL